MHHRQDAHQKGSDNSASARVSPQFQSRPFGLGSQSETTTPQQQETPDLQTQLERAKRFGPDFSRVKVRGEGPPPTIQQSLFFGEQRDQEEPVTDASALPVRSMPASRVNLPPIQRQDAEWVGNQPNLAARMMPVVQRQSQPIVSIPRQSWIQRIEEQPEAKLEQEDESALVQAKLENATVQRQSEANVEEEAEESLPVQTQLENATVQRQSEEGENIQTKLSVQRAGPDGGVQANSSIENTLASQKGGGSPLDEDVRSFMEPRFGNDFSSIRIHTGSTAVQMNKELHAQAFTHGSDIYFNEGKYNPASNEGKQLLAHELTHVVQQTGAVQPKSMGNKQRNPFQREEGELKPLQAKKLTDPTAELIQNKTDQGSSKDVASTEKGAKDEATAPPSSEGQTEAVSPEDTSATAANEAASMVDNTQAVTEQEKTTVEQQAAEAKAEMEGEIASMKAEPLPSLAELIEPGPEGTGEEIDSIVPPTSPQPELQLPIDTASLSGSGEGSELALPTNLGNQSNFASANATSSQVASNKFKPDLYETSQSSGSTVIQMDLDPAAEQNPDTGYSVEAARSAVRGIAGTIEASSEQARQSIQAQTETVSATLTANAAALSQVIQAQAAQNVASLHEKFAAQRTQIQTFLQATRDQISTALDARKSEATTRGDQAKTDFTQLFTDHRGHVETAVQDNVTAAEQLRTNNEKTARDRIAAQASAARQRGEAKASGYPGDERGQAQAGAVRKVAEDTAKEIEGRESEVINAIGECTAGIPEEFEKKGQEALQGFDQGLPDLLKGVDEQVQAVINKLTEQADRVYQQLDSLQEQQISQLDASEAAAVSRVQALDPQAQTQIQSGTQMALTALDASAQQAVGQICPFVTQASQTLQSIEAPDVEKANQYAQQVMSFATGASSEVAGGMQEVSNGMAQQSSQTEVAINQSLQQNEQQTNQQLQAITESNQTALSNLVTKVDEGFGQIIQSLDTAFLEVETQIETKLSQALEELVQGFEQKLQEADAKVAEAVNEGLAKNDEALSQLGGKMQEAADEAAWRHDHPVLATLADIGGFVAGLVIGIVAVLALVALVIVGFKVLIAGLVALGVSLVVAKIVAAVVGLGLLAYGIYQAYQARKEAGAEGGWGTFGMALLDLTGLTAIHRGVTQEGLSPFQRGLAIGEGVGTLASFFLARGMNRRISNRLPNSITNPIRGSFWQRFGGGRGNPKVPGPRPTGTARPGWGQNNTSDIPNNKQTPVTNKVSGAPPVDAGKQGKHVSGHPNNTPSKSRWRPGVDHVFETQNAWQKGQPVPGQPQARSYRPGYVVGENGENSIKVHMDNNGLIHGVPNHRPPTAPEVIADQGLNNLPAPVGASASHTLDRNKEQE